MMRWPARMRRVANAPRPWMADVRISNGGVGAGRSLRHGGGTECWRSGRRRRGAVKTPQDSGSRRATRMPPHAGRDTHAARRRRRAAEHAGQCADACAASVRAIPSRRPAFGAARALDDARSAVPARRRAPRRAPSPSTRRRPRRPARRHAAHRGRAAPVGAPRHRSPASTITLRPSDDGFLDATLTAPAARLYEVRRHRVRRRRAHGEGGGPDDPAGRHRHVPRAVPAREAAPQHVLVDCGLDAMGLRQADSYSVIDARDDAGGGRERRRARRCARSCRRRGGRRRTAGTRSTVRTTGRLEERLAEAVASARTLKRRVVRQLFSRRTRLSTAGRVRRDGTERRDVTATAGRLRRDA